MSALSRPWTGRTFLFWILGFFAIVFAANMVFVWFAADTWTGLAAEESYRRGIDYNRVIDRAETQAALGWVTETEFVRDSDTSGTLTFNLRNAEGVEIANRTVTAAFRRPVVEGQDFETTLVAMAPGQYSADVVLPSPGQWDVRLEISWPATQPYLVETRIWSK